MQPSNEKRGCASAVSPMRSAKRGRRTIVLSKRTQSRPAFHPFIRRCAFARSGAQRAQMENPQIAKFLSTDVRSSRSAEAHPTPIWRYTSRDAQVVVALTRGHRFDVRYGARGWRADGAGEPTGGADDAGRAPGDAAQARRADRCRLRGRDGQAGG